ncbi:methyltransferase, FxLD system [Myceligenerans pegani]|uniref:Protein-L-isoaspartate O-methyltransferase n=1 Tax=Myceligenerans pegani TaxID=2776917 RepID=A0ABR9MUI6_9MICO|nr:methyltransferase, FxLD system [Myceligenerans sp. TRM 65318]MBE1875043.1 methyltransferase, FxLD system [Myceligenerans sp. TRM 65318]MBE3017314.1 methyltransferase, FxLD system [Myceligenerans sp. TRM 65318]
MDERSMDDETMRLDMLDRLVAMRGYPLAEEVAEAMRVVPRHVFVPQAPLSEAYGLGAVITHRDAHNVPISSASAPGTVAGMLEQAQVRPGHRVLEIGAGTGYNAALLAHLVGPSGSVTTIEFDPDVAEAAREHLIAYGADQVRVVTGDGTIGDPSQAPFDRILVTAGAWDVAPAWVDQLAPGGRIVLPLRLRGLTRVVAFERDGDRLRSVSVAEDGFIPMKGIGAIPEKNVPLGQGPDITLRIDDNQPVASALSTALDEPPVFEWTAIESPWAWTPDQDFWLATLPGFCRVFVDAEAVTAGRVPRAKDPWGAWGVHAGGSVAYMTAQQVGGTDEMPMLQVGACGFGPAGADLARQLTDRARAWLDETAGEVDITIEARPAAEASASDEVAALLIARKTDHEFVVTAARKSEAMSA